MSKYSSCYSIKLLWISFMLREDGMDLFQLNGSNVGWFAMLDGRLHPQGRSSIKPWDGWFDNYERWLH